jgi:hypothetical protein
VQHGALVARARDEAERDAAGRERLALLNGRQVPRCRSVALLARVVLQGGVHVLVIFNVACGERGSLVVCVSGRRRHDGDVREIKHCSGTAGGSQSAADETRRAGRNLFLHKSNASL